MRERGFVILLMMIMVIISVSIIDYLCGKLRNQFI